ncbi:MULTISPECIES: hypothetical protein [unclassified Rhodococcus (in: high G+C Gram-positive bacteria)]|uniref:hypothetical protein n=1 Tax=unclassified Rhodococcus (in: high G+C Gram-positive bacteria) TaxID=192944 RepID=UPI00163A0F70|nr:MULTISPECIES: hypothetical protein [unclassified Rhodococcus (in: high G+C Gram-positive bacteria)]MBC2641978.1 hypothetical protein [Rhodococcus sp. 3A]MBC2893281.1 hypothetical protein [Rhodococcus sp. 4CII]
MVAGLSPTLMLLYVWFTAAVGVAVEMSLMLALYALSALAATAAGVAVAAFGYYTDPVTFVCVILTVVMVLVAIVGAARVSVSPWREWLPFRDFDVIRRGRVGWRARTR